MSRRACEVDLDIVVPGLEIAPQKSHAVRVRIGAELSRLVCGVDLDLVLNKAALQFVPFLCKATNVALDN